MHTMKPRPHLFSYFFVLQRTNPRDRSLILAILTILAILLQTERMRGTGPRATGGPRAPVGPDRLIWTCL